MCIRDSLRHDGLVSFLTVCKYSSLDVHLVNGNLDGIVKFKLFIPETRNNQSEIITASILHKMGYLSPRSKYVEATINGFTKKMILHQFLVNLNTRTILTNIAYMLKCSYCHILKAISM
mgnify:CR=1 FL=1